MRRVHSIHLCHVLSYRGQQHGLACREGADTWQAGAQSQSPPEMLPEQLAWASMPTAALLDQLCAAQGLPTPAPASGAPGAMAIRIYMLPGLDDMGCSHQAGTSY